MLSNSLLSNFPWVRLCLVLVLGLVVCGGCGGGLGVPSSSPVRGVVNFKGKPAPGIRVKFHLKNPSGKAQFVPIGDTGADGGFSMSTGDANNGAPPGEYLVTFEMPVISETEAVETEVDALQGKYSDPAQSKFTVTIKRGENNLPPFELE